MKIKASGVLIFLVSLGCTCVQGQSSAPLTLQKTFALPEGTAKFDHFVVDLKANRLFIAATGNHTVEVMDTNTGTVLETLAGIGKPHGLAWVPETGTLYVADGTKGDLKVYAGTPLKLMTTIKLSDDADDMVYDAKSKLLYVGHGGSSASVPAAIAIVDTTSQTLIGNLPVDAHPEGLEIDSAKQRIFVDIADASTVAVIDGATHTQTANWKLTRAHDNVPLAYDGQDNLLFVACRAPARLLVLDASTGKEIADLPSGAGADDLFYDAAMRRVYLIAGAGVVDVYQMDAAKTLHAIGVVDTSAGAKTGLLVPEQHALYVGAAATTTKPAQILLYSTR